MATALKETPWHVNSASGFSPLVLLLGVMSLAAFWLSGCGGGKAPASSPQVPPAMPAEITTEPLPQSVPMGLSATYSVVASGSSLTYQWSRNGAPISGANAGTYTTPATAFADSGSEFTVAVANSAGSVTSSPASLTVTARAPKAGDLRFQQVDAPATVDGYGNGPTSYGSAIPGRGGASFTPSIGTQLNLTPGDCALPPEPPGVGCSWAFEQFFLPGNLASLGLSMYYGGDFFTSFPADFGDSFIVAGSGNPPGASNSVITSLDLEPSLNLFAASWIQSSEESGFDLSQQTVPVADLQAALTQEGLNHRVVTAISFNADQVTYLSYGWQSDLSSIYEANVVTVPIAQLPTAAAAALAADGYIITANGGSGFSDSFFLVGTRLQGDTMPRPFLAVQYVGDGQKFVKQEQLGYAIVGVVNNFSGGFFYLTER